MKNNQLEQQLKTKIADLNKATTFENVKAKQNIEVEKSENVA